MSSHRWKRDKATKFIKSWCDLVRRTFNSAEARGMSAEWITEQLNEDKHIGSLSANYEKLPIWAKEAAYTYQDARWQQWSGEWLWTHVIDGTRSECHDKRFEGRHGEISDANPTASEAEKKNNSDRSMHCYAYLITGRIVFVPVNVEDFRDEMKSGRLTQEDVDEIRQFRAKPLPCVKARNKRLFVEVEVEVSNTETGVVRFPSIIQTA